MNPVAITLERALNGVPGITYMSAVISNNGVTLITVYFNVGIDPDIAAVSVQNRVATVIEELPEEFIRAEVSTEKEKAYTHRIERFKNTLSRERSLLALKHCLFPRN
jgi:multidrug efflux pump subunit AcrB